MSKSLVGQIVERNGELQYQTREYLPPGPVRAISNEEFLIPPGEERIIPGIATPIRNGTKQNIFVRFAKNA